MTPPWWAQRAADTVDRAPVDPIRDGSILGMHRPNQGLLAEDSHADSYAEFDPAVMRGGVDIDHVRARDEGLDLVRLGSHPLEVRHDSLVALRLGQQRPERGQPLLAKLRESLLQPFHAVGRELGTTVPLAWPRRLLRPGCPGAPVMRRRGRLHMIGLCQ